MKRVGRGRYVCALPDCGKPLNELTVKNEDPFHSTACANVWHEFVPTSTMFSLNGRPMGGNQGGGRPPKYDRRVA